MKNFLVSFCAISCTLVACQQPNSYGMRSQRKQGPVDHMRITFGTHHNSRGPPQRKKNGVPPYAVHMEPMVQYSQPDPLYSIEKQFISEAKPPDASSNDLIKYPGAVMGDIIEGQPISRVGHITHARLRPPMHVYHSPRPHRGRPMPPPHLKPPQMEFPPYGHYWEEPQVEVVEPPEPIIEIIIKESNESLPAPPPLPTPPPPKKVKEPVQVFYVKYSKDPNGGYGGEEKVIYDPPVPAVTPPENNGDPEEEEPELEPVIETDHGVTPAPPPSTTLKAIVRPDSETFHSDSGVRISFGPGEEEHSGPSAPYGQGSDPQPAIALPDHSKSHISRSSETSNIAKRNPPPFNGHQFQGFPQPTNFQQLPQFPARDFAPPSPHYSTLPQNLLVQRPQQQQRYTTINNPPPPEQYHTINSHPNASPSPLINQPPVHRNPPRPPLQEHQQRVEQVNRLQLQQQQLNQHRFQQPQFNQKTQFSQQPSQQIYTQHTQQTIFPSQQPVAQPHHQPHQPQSFPQLQYTPNFATNHRVESHSTFVPTPRPLSSTPSPAQQYFRSTTTTTTEVVTEIVTEDPKKVEQEKKLKEEKQKKNIANLPDEVPDDLRQQLLSSGILSNADIEILDYDKVGDIPIENLPPEALASFQQAAGSEQRFSVRKPDDSDGSASERRTVTVNTEDGEMEMKVVRFNQDEDVGVPERYIKKDATRVAPVVLNDNKYNRYLPLQVSGAQFPVPDIPELRGRNVSSVVVLAPVDYEFLNRRDENGDSRTGRSAAPVLEVQGVHFIAGDVLKTLVRMPSEENYRRWLEKENSTSVEKQSVVLLVVGPSADHPEKEIFMYDISSGRVSKLRGELSTTFVKVAESNSNNRDLEEISDESSVIIDQNKKPNSRRASKPTR